MQRFFATFPNSWPGGGLLLLRIAAAAPLLSGAVADLHSALGPTIPVLAGVALTSAVLLATGFLTPIAALAQTLLDLRLAVESGRLLSEHEVLVSIGLSLMMLGPGAWSVDAVLFGRRRVHWVDHR